MVFNSIEFAIFLPVVFLLYWLVFQPTFSRHGRSQASLTSAHSLTKTFIFNRKLRIQNLFIVAVSYLFYGWWDWRFLLLIAFTSFCSWGSGLLIDRYRYRRNTAKWISAANIVVNLFILFLFKYYDFFVTSFAEMFLGGKTEGLLLKIILPVGISFYTFQALSYSIDVYKNKITPVKDIVQFFAFVSFFPQLVAGPIERASNLLPQFGKKRVFDYARASDGMRQILWGLFKKCVVADTLAVYVDKVFADPAAQNGSTLFIAAVFFAFQIYGDFSGYSDIAIGTSKLFGIKLKQNFNVPYFSRDIAEFWRRWHISLTTWFRDYVYIPLGGSRCSKAKVIRNTLIIFLLSGLWHGANWTFLVWGAYHAVLFLPLILLGKNRKYTETVAADRLLPSPKEILQILITFFLVVMGWIVFRAESIGQVGQYLGGMWHWETLRAVYGFFTRPEVWPGTLAILFMQVVEWIGRKQEHGFCLNGIKSIAWRYVVYLALWLLVLWCATAGEPTQFIYFQF